VKRIAIIGASSGIGKEMAICYAQAGHLVAVAGRRENLLRELKNLYPLQITTFCFDVTTGENKAYLEQMIAELGGLDLFIYNAGIGYPSKHLDESMEIGTTRTNVNGFVEMTVAAFNYFMEQGKGQIAVTSSIAAIRGNSWAPAYSASKAFMSNYAESLNLKAKRTGKDIIVTDIKPGFINTKTGREHGRFWVSTKEKAARQMIRAIEKKKRIAYITRRWWLIAQILKVLPFSVYRKIG
jgi:short-subunit dehydrogenase